MRITAPKFVGASSFRNNDEMVYHIGTPASGEGYLLRYNRKTREFTMRRLAADPDTGSRNFQNATREELAEALALMPPEEIARCTAASLNP